MITRAIVEELLSPYEVRVRIPLLDRASDSMLATKKENLNIATICTLPNCYINVQVGDIVFVGFEDNTTYKAVILGHLCREALTNSFPDMTLNNLVARASAILPEQTSIGDVTSLELSRISGARDNIQKQLDSLKEQQERILAKLFPNG